MYVATWVKANIVIASRSLKYWSWFFIFLWVAHVVRIIITWYPIGMWESWVCDWSTVALLGMSSVSGSNLLGLNFGHLSHFTKSSCFTLPSPCDGQFSPCIVWFKKCCHHAHKCSFSFFPPHNISKGLHFSFHMSYYPIFILVKRYLKRHFTYVLMTRLRSYVEYYRISFPCVFFTYLRVNATHFFNTVTWLTMVSLSCFFKNSFNWSY